MRRRVLHLDDVTDRHAGELLVGIELHNRKRHGERIRVVGVEQSDGAPRSPLQNEPTLRRLRGRRFTHRRIVPYLWPARVARQRQRQPGVRPSGTEDALALALALDGLGCP